MPSKRYRLPHTFPHKIVFIISLVLCMCACGSIVNAVIAWTNYLWGYYLGTGFWSGAVILLAGMFGIVASYVRSICAVKTFMIISIFGCIASLGMIALAAGGLDPESGFYDGYNKTTFMTHVVHAVYLGLGVLQVALGVLSDGICIYYLFIERGAEIYCVKGDETKKRQKKRGNIRRQGKERSSTGSQVPLVAESNSFKRKSKNDKDGSVNRKSSEPVDEITDANDVFPIPYTATGLLDRETLLRQEMLMSKISPLKSTPYRSASFSTFGRTGGPDRESLIVHPTDDNASVADTITTNPQSLDDECHYAQTMLFGPPLPIEEDEALPPYEVVDQKPFRHKPRKGLKRPKSEELNVSGRQSRRPYILQEREKRSNSKRSRSSQTRSKIPHGRNDAIFETGSLKRPPSKKGSYADDGGAVLRLSKSADLLALDDETQEKKSSQGGTGLQEQGAFHEDFTDSYEMIRVLGQAVQLRHKRPQSQTVRVNRDKRIDRRHKALSAEVRLNKVQSLSREGILGNETDFEQRTSSIYGSNPSLFAGSRILPTKFSLRTPVRQIGMPHVCSPVPVKPLVTVPRVSNPPPKPPRNFSYSADELLDLELDADGEVEEVLGGINDLNDAKCPDDDVFTQEQVCASENKNKENLLKDIEQKPCKVAVIQASRILLPDREIVSEMKSQGNVTNNFTSSAVPLSPEVKLDSGPVLKYSPSKCQAKPPVDDADDSGIPNKLQSDSVFVNKTSEVQIGKHPSDTMALPTSPVLRRPPVAILPTNSQIKASRDISNIFEITDNGLQKPKNAEVIYAKVVKEPPVAILTVNKINGRDKLKLGDLTEIDKGDPENSSYRPQKPDNVEMVYAKAVKESPASPSSPISLTSPVSPTSPTSPSSKVQKAKRLTYTFKNKDVSVFDPIGNTKETEETNEGIQSTSANQPIETPKGKPQPSEQNKPPATENHFKFESGPNVKVRMPPLSPSERILQRKANTKEDQRDVSPSKKDRPVILQPANAYKDFSKSDYGARPKTSYKGLFAPLSPPKESIVYRNDFKQTESEPKLKQSTNRTSDGTVNLSECSKENPTKSLQSQGNVKNRLPQIAPKPSNNRKSDSKKTSNNLSNNSVQFLPSVTSSTSQTTATNISRDVPVNRVQALSVSQGVLHLPQSQYSRHVPGNAPPSAVARDTQHAVGAARNVNVIPQNNSHNNDDESNKPLFSVLL